MDSSTVEEARRHREILDRTRMGLNDDLDDLRSELVDELEGFETQLRDLSRQLPGWLDLPKDTLLTPFRLSEPAELEDTLIGPRAVAFIAGAVEEFLLNWLGDGETIPVWRERSDPGARRRLADDLHALEAQITEALDAVDALADQGPIQLEHTLESIVFELQTRRETDVEALESLITTGDIERGKDAREEIAELWEEQRARVDELQLVWDDILNLHHEGIAQTIDGIEELQQLAKRTREGITGANITIPAATNAGDDEDTEDADDAEDADVIDISEESEPDAQIEVDAGNSDADLVEESSAPESKDLEPAQKEESPKGASTQPPIDDEAPPPTAPTIPDAVSDVDGDGSLGDPESNPFLRSPSDAEIVESDSVEDDADSEPPSASETQPDFGPTQPSFDFPESELPDETESSETSGDVANTAPLSESVPETAPVDPLESSEQPESYELGDTVVLSDERAEVADEPAESSDDDDSERMRVRTFRIREGWQTVSGDEIAIVLGPAGLIISALLVLSLLSLVDLADNPMAVWDWGLGVVIATMILLVALPLFFRWRPMWRGTRFRIIRRGEVEEEVDLRLTDDGTLILDRTSWSLNDLKDAELRRWVFGDEDSVGWLLTISPPYHSPFHLATYADDLSAWKRSRIDRCEPPLDAWQIPPGEFDVICEAIDVSRP